MHAGFKEPKNEQKVPPDKKFCVSCENAFPGVFKAKEDILVT